MLRLPYVCVSGYEPHPSGGQLEATAPCLDVAPGFLPLTALPRRCALSRPLWAPSECSVRRLDASTCMAARAADRNSPHYARHERAHGRKKMIWERWSKKHLEKEQMVNWRTLLISRNRFKIYAGSCSVCLATKQRTREFHSITLTPEQKGSRKAKHPRNASANKARSPPSLVASAVPRSRHSSLDARWLVFTGWSHLQ